MIKLLIEYKPLKLIEYKPFNATKAFLNGLINSIEYKEAIKEYKRINNINLNSAIKHRLDIYI